MQNVSEIGAGFGLEKQAGSTVKGRELAKGAEDTISLIFAAVSARVNPEAGTLTHFQNCRVAIRAPSAKAANFAQTTSGSTAAWPTQVP